MFFKNWAETGKWKPDGLRQNREQYSRSVKIQLAMIDWKAMTKTEAIQFIRKLDILVESKNNNTTTAECKMALQKAHTEGQSILNANNCTILKQQRSKIIGKLKKKT